MLAAWAAERWTGVNRVKVWGGIGLVDNRSTGERGYWIERIFMINITGSVLENRAAKRGLTET